MRGTGNKDLAAWMLKLDKTKIPPLKNPVRETCGKDVLIVTTRRREKKHIQTLGASSINVVF